jgi:hypothetical protein
MSNPFFNYKPLFMIKRVFFIVLAACMCLAACGPNKPDNKIGRMEITPGLWKPAADHKSTVQAMDTTVQISPTWGQAGHYAHARPDQTIYDIIGIVLLLVFAVTLYGRIAEAKWFPDVSERGLFAFWFVVLALAATAFLGVKSSVKWNNYKMVPKAQYDKAMKETGSTKPIWDSLEQNCKITWGPYNCYK